MFDAEIGLNYNYFRDYDSSLGRYIQSDPIGLAGGINTFAYVWGNPLRFVDPFGLASQVAGGGWEIRCTINDIAFTVPKPKGFPNSLDSSQLFYHETHVVRNLDGADMFCVRRMLQQQPTPGQPNPATPDGTKNNAQITLFPSNLVTSYLTETESYYIPDVVNTAGLNDGSSFGPGYVARYTDGENVYTVGEGTAWEQSWGRSSDLANELLWGRDLERIIEECKCKK